MAKFGRLGLATFRVNCPACVLGTVDGLDMAGVCAGAAALAGWLFNHGVALLFAGRGGTAAGVAGAGCRSLREPIMTTEEPRGFSLRTVGTEVWVGGFVTAGGDTFPRSVRGAGVRVLANCEAGRALSVRVGASAVEDGAATGEAAAFSRSLRGPR